MNILLADIGGTNTRCAVTDDDGRPARVATYSNREFDGPDQLLAGYLDSIGKHAARPRRAVIGVAAPVRGDEIRMINLDWSWSMQELRQTLAMLSIDACNDFEALALALPELSPGQLVRVGGGDALERQTKVVLGPGTGLGVASLVPFGDDGWRPVSGEGGHVTMAGRNAAEDAIIERARTEFGHCSAERLISGAGIAFVHAALHGSADLTAAEIGRLAETGDAQARETLEMVFGLLGTVAADLALTLGAFGGVYIGGGIVPKNRARFASSGFRARFEDKGRYREYLRGIATSVIVAEHPGLLGLAARGRGAAA